MQLDGRHMFLGPWIAATLALATPTVAGAQTKPDPELTSAEIDARALRSEAEAAFEAGDYEIAIVSFERAYELSPHPTDLFNLGRVYEERGDLEDALGYYESFAALPRLSLAKRNAAAERIEVLRKIVNAESDEDPAVPVQPAARSQTDGVPSSDRARPLIISGAVLAGVGTLAAIGGGVGFGLVARGTTEDINRLADGQNPSRLTLAETEELHAKGRNAEALQVTFLAAGSAMALVGAGLLTAGLITRKRSETATIAPVAGPGFAGAVTRWKF